MRQGILVATLALMTSASAWAHDQADVWDGGVRGDVGFATNCHECQDDAHISIYCEPGRDRVTVEFPAVQPPLDAAPGEFMLIRFEIDGRSFEKNGEVDLFKEVPSFRTPKNDPLLARLMSGSMLTLAFENDTSAVPLKGSGAAIRAMLSACQ